MDTPMIRLHVIDLRLRRPFTTADGSISFRRLGIVEHVDAGVTGWGEAAPFPGQDESFSDVVEAASGNASSVTLDAALDQAAADWRARVDRVALAEPAGGSLPVSVAVGLDEPAAVVAELIDRGIGRFKVKVAPGRVDHVVRLRAEHPDLVLGVDANRSFDATNVHQLEMLGDVGVAYVEEPLAHRDRTLAHRLRVGLSAPLFVDESVASWPDVALALADPAVDGITIKPGRMGWVGALEAANAAEVAGKLWRASGLLESGVGRAFTDALATRSPAISDVAPAELFLDEDLVGSRWLGDGLIAVPPGPGIGVEPDRASLERHTVRVVPIAPEVSRRRGRGRG